MQDLTGDAVQAVAQLTRRRVCGRLLPDQVEQRLGGLPEPGTRDVPPVRAEHGVQPARIGRLVVGVGIGVLGLLRERGEVASGGQRRRHRAVRTGLRRGVGERHRVDPHGLPALHRCARARVVPARPLRRGVHIDVPGHRGPQLEVARAQAGLREAVGGLLPERAEQAARRVEPPGVARVARLVPQEQLVREFVRELRRVRVGPPRPLVHPLVTAHEIDRQVGVLVRPDRLDGDVQPVPVGKFVPRPVVELLHALEHPRQDGVRVRLPVPGTQGEPHGQVGDGLTGVREAPHVEGRPHDDARPVVEAGTGRFGRRRPGRRGVGGLPQRDAQRRHIVGFRDQVQGRVVRDDPVGRGLLVHVRHEERERVHVVHAADPAAVAPQDQARRVDEVVTEPDPSGRRYLFASGEPDVAGVGDLVAEGLEAGLGVTRVREPPVRPGARRGRRVVRVLGGRPLALPGVRGYAGGGRGGHVGGGHDEARVDPVTGTPDGDRAADGPLLRHRVGVVVARAARQARPETAGGDLPGPAAVVVDRDVDGGGGRVAG